VRAGHNDRVAQIRQLRIVATLLFAFAVAQAGLGSGYLDDVKPLLVAHATNAFAVLVLAVIGAVLGVSLRRAGRPSWTLFMPVGIIIAIAVQMMLGFAEVKGAHVFLGVLILCSITAYCSYSWRLRVPEGGATSTTAPASA
jgi:heme A synthase